MIELIENQYGVYPRFQAEGFAAQFAFPFARKLCAGYGVDIGCNREEWKLPGAMAVDPNMNTEYDAYNLPGRLDYIFSSHCLEHLADWVGAIDYWNTRLSPGGVLVLYLPHPKQVYWRPWNNRKHLHSLSPKLLRQCLKSGNGWTKIFVTGRDLNNSFYAIAEKTE